MMKQKTWTILFVAGLAMIVLLAQPVTSDFIYMEGFSFTLTSSNLTVRNGTNTLTLGQVDEAAITARVLARLTNSVIAVRGTNITFTLTLRP
ncbi:MAG: hypothetical protein HW378_181 [Anaerolineales bacterium]|nr:hypothetical protein [Anaerolineales bacterium]